VTPPTEKKGFLFKLRRIPGFNGLIVLILLSGLAEAIGLSALVPVVYTLTQSQPENMPYVFSFLPEMLEYLGLESEFAPLLLVTLGTILTSYLLVHVADRYAAHSRALFLRRTRDDILSALFSSGWERFSRVSKGDLVNQVMLESDRGVESHYSLIQMIAIFIQVLVYSGVALMLSWEMFSIALLVIIFVGLVSRRLIQRARFLGKKITTINDGFTSQIVDYLGMRKVIKAGSVESNFKSKLARSSENSAFTLKSIVVGQSKMRFELQVLLGLSVGLILYLAVEVLFVDVSVLLIFLFIIMRLAPKFSVFQSQYHAYTAFAPAMENIDEQILISVGNAENQTDIKLMAFKGLTDCISLSEVYYRYPEEGKDVIRGINMRIPVGKMIAIVGPSGCGKSTLLDLLVGLVPPKSGLISVDGVDVRNLDAVSYRKKIGLVPQEVSLFAGTIKDNVTLLNHIDEEAVANSIAYAQMSDYVEGQPEGLNTLIGESGKGLSGGQQQRLCIARALVRNPSLVVLDEATSSLDGESETRFQSAIEGMIGKFTLVVVAHRLSTIRKADWIYCMADGRIVEEGTYENLSKVNGPFSKMLQTQKI